MHGYFIVRGKRNYVRNFLEYLEDHFFPYSWTDTKGTKKDITVQLVPREVKIIEMVYPEKSHPEVMKLIGTRTYPHYKFLNKIRRALTKMLGLTPLKKEEEGKEPIRPTPNVAVHFLGTKKDRITPDGNEEL